MHTSISAMSKAPAVGRAFFKNLLVMSSKSVGTFNAAMEQWGFRFICRRDVLCG